MLKKMNSLKPVHVHPIYLFITGSAGVGKSHLIKTIYHTVIGMDLRILKSQLCY